MTRGIITYDDDNEAWEIGTNDKSRKMIYGELVKTIRDEVIAPAKHKLASMKERNNLDAAFNVSVNNPYFTSKIPDLASKPFSGAKKMILRAARQTLKTESLKKIFINACDKVLTEMYAKRYKVRLNEAKKMFVLNDKIFG